MNEKPNMITSLNDLAIQQFSRLGICRPRCSRVLFVPKHLAEFAFEIAHAPGKYVIEYDLKPRNDMQET
jgi:hypothetical protein